MSALVTSDVAGEAPHLHQPPTDPEYNEHQERIQVATRLDFCPNKLGQVYDQWAEQYDDDVRSSKYTAPGLVANLLADHLEDIETARVLDIGCGTGLAAVALAERGFKLMDGFDLSQGMVERAAKLGVFDKLWGKVDMTKPIKLGDEKYDAAVAVGVFTTGHVRPETVENVLPYMNKGGLVLITTRVEYRETHKLEEYLADVRSRGLLELVDCLKEQEYHDISKADYYLLKVL